ncbi:exopolygalacturonase-like [Dendrobium catenatum]|uniref:exopolygalacturonase-like n=1 Tax=Dendrobium catenatum TaxID=906689 RepID=UPI00109F51C9|nr:exopolygalacturonase-like [Dendrobium catenatum]
MQSLNFSFVSNATIRGITSINSKNVHIQIFASNNINLHSIKLMAPENSPNTDGIHVGESKNISISQSIISTGDDCISIGPGTANLSISGVRCGPGHGISIGSLGGGKDEGDVVGISVRNCTFSDTENGVRIKTWQESPTFSSAYDLVFEELVMNNVDNPIVIDQKYCPHNLCGSKAPSLVKISNVKFRNITGETRTKNAINLVCSDRLPCEDIELSNIDLKYSVAGDFAVASCVNVKGRSFGLMIPPSCI